MTSDWKSGFVDVGGVRLHYTRTGDGTKPPVVLAHGFSDDGPCWTPVAAFLENDYDVIMPDARGHGLSDAPATGGYGPSEQAADLAGIIAALGVKRPAVLGHSMGAITTLALAGTFSNVPHAILLEDPGAPWMTTSESLEDAATRAEERRLRMGLWINTLQEKTRDEMIAGQRAESPGWSEAELGPWADSKRRFRIEALDRRTAAPVDWPTILRNVSCPALLITADPARGAIIAEESAAALAALVPRLRRENIPNAGHSIRRDQFAAYCEAIRAFLRETVVTG